MTSTLDLPGRVDHAATRLRAVVAGAWSAAVGLVGLLWTVRLVPFPFGSNDIRAREVGWSLLPASPGRLLPPAHPRRNPSRCWRVSRTTGTS